MKPRLLILLNRLSIGGPASNTLPLASALQSQFEILLVAGNPLPDEQSALHLLDRYKGFQTIIVPEIKRSMQPVQDLKTYKKLLQIIRDFNPQIVHTHGAKPGFLGRLAAAKCKVPLIVHTYHGHVFKSYFSPFVSGMIIRIERILAKKSHLLIAINEQLRKELIHDFKIADASKVVINRLGIDANIFNDQEGVLRKKFRSEFKISDNEVIVAIVGRLVKIKQHHLFISIADELLKKKDGKIRYCFFIVGDGAEYEQLEEKAESLGHRVLKKNNIAVSEFDIAFTSWRKDIDCVMAGIDILLMTSLNEGTPVAILEAMATAKPIVSTPVGGIPELIKAAGCGFISSEKEEIVKQLQLLASSNGLREEKGLQGLHFLTTHLTIEHQSEGLTQLYFKGLQRTQSAAYQ